jgi:hypoxanthine-guanine phosphoribosyltransferase
VDDIYDSGNTINAVIEYLSVKHPASISIVTLLTRETSPTPTVPFYYGFKIKDEWIVGMGCDDEKGYCRNLPSVWSL